MPTVDATSIGSFYLQKLSAQLLHICIGKGFLNQESIPDSALNALHLFQQKVFSQQTNQKDVMRVGFEPTPFLTRLQAELKVPGP